MKFFWRFVVRLFLLPLLPAGAYAADPPSRYVNNNDAYQVDIPAGCLAESDAPPVPQHGFQLVCGKNVDITVDGSYDAGLWGSARAAAIVSENDDGITPTIVSKSLLIDGLQAAWVKAAAKGQITEILTIYRPLPDTPMIYSFWVETNAENVAKDHGLLKQLVASLKILPFTE